MNIKNINLIQFSQAKYTFRFILFLILVSANEIFAGIFKFNLPFSRYLFASISTFYLISSIYNERKKLIGISKLNKLLIYLLLFWSIVMIVMGMPEVFSGYYNHMYIKILISGQLLLYLTPFALLIHPNILLYRSITRTSTALSIIYLIITIPLFSFFIADMRNGAENYASFFAAGSSFLILTYPYHSKRVNYIALITNLIALLITSFLARRNQAVYFSSVLLFSIILSFLSHTSIIRKRRNYIMLIVSFSIIFLFLLVNLNILNFDPILNKFGTGFENRQSIFDDFIWDFNETNDWLIGRGINGDFYSSTNAALDKDTRDGIENGYLQYILKGGLIYLILFILISIVSSFKGLFRSKNILTKAFASIILINLIDMVGFGIPTLSFRYVIIWFAIAGALSPWLRNLDDRYIAHNIGIK